MLRLSARPAAAATLALALALALSACGASGSGSTATPTAGSSTSGSASAAGTVVDGERTYSDLSRNHVEGPVSYPQSPPVGGDHYQVWVPCDGRVYDTPVPNERAVHSLEHGAVWVTWEPTLPQAEIEALHAQIEGIDYRFGSPYPGLASPITLTAWGHQMDAETADDPRIATFLSAYTNGPQTPEPGATCSDPTGASPDVHAS